MAVVDPNYSVNNLRVSLDYTGVEGVHPNPEQFALAELQRIANEIKTRFRADDEAIVAYFNAQLAQVNGLINALADGVKLQQAVELLDNIANIVDADGNGVLDALGPLNATIQGMQTTITSLQATQQAQQGEINALQGQLAQHTTAFAAMNDAFLDVSQKAENNKDAIENVADNVAMNMQGLRDALRAVDVAWTPIVLPAPVFATTNVTGGGESGDPSAV